MVDNTTVKAEDKTKKEKPVSVISVGRDTKLNIDIADPLNLDQLYATVPEVSRAIDFRAGIVSNNGYEIIPASDDEKAKELAAICFQVLERSGGTAFFEQLHKNTDLYGDGYEELVVNGLGQVVELAHVHPYRFGYETEKIDDPDNPGQEMTVIKVDKNSQKPVGFATYVPDPATGELLADKKIALEKIAHLKFKTVGDNFNGISLVQPMLGSVTRKIRLEDYADRAARLIAVPKLVLYGEYEDEEDKRQDAKEAASLDVNDVVILSGENAKADYIKPGETNIPNLREMFITNITTASGVPRPALTSESAEINKATMYELMRNLRDIMKSHQRKISNLFHAVIFPRIALSYKITDYEGLLPSLYFHEDDDSTQVKIDVVKRKAEALTSLSNTYSILLSAIGGNPVDEPVGKRAENGNDNPDSITKDDSTTKTDTAVNDAQKQIIEEMEKLILTTIKHFNISDDISPYNIEDYKKVSAKETKREVENARVTSVKKGQSIELEMYPNYYTKFSLKDGDLDFDQKKDNLKLAYGAYKSGKTLLDKETDKIISLPDLISYGEKLKVSKDTTK